VRRLLPVLALLVVGPAALPGQTQVVTLRAGKVLDGKGGTISSNLVIVQGSRILRTTGPAEGAIYDLSGLTLMPGGIDTHTHPTWHFGPDGRFATQRNETPEQTILFTAENAYRTLMGGVTTIQSLGDPRDKDLRDAIARGVLPGPRILSSLGSISDPRMTPDQIREAVRLFKGNGADVIKIFASASIRDGGAPTLSQEQMNAACGEARAVGLRAVVHSHGPESTRRSVMAGCTAIEHGSLLDEPTLRLMAEHGTYYDPNIGLVLQNYLENKEHYFGIGNYNAQGFAEMERAIPLALNAFKISLKIPNMKIVFGTDAVAGAHGRNFEEIIYRVQRGGQDPMAAIVDATSRSAQSLNLGDQIGSIAPGMQADVIGLNGDPTTDITALRRVMFVLKGGVVYKNQQDGKAVGRNGGEDDGDVTRSATALPPYRPTAPADWPVYGGDAGGMKYSPLTTISRANVARLAPAWQWAVGEALIPQTDSTKAARPGTFQATPLMIHDTLFLSTPFNRVVALDANTGRELWSYDPGAYRFGQPSNGTGFVHRGVAAWTDGKERRIFMNSRWRLIALDAATGRPIPSFGANGEVDLTAHILWKVNQFHYTNTSPPVVYRDLVIVGNGVGDRLVYPNDPPGDVQAFDVRTGELVWRFNPIPQPGEFGNDTWQGNGPARTGHTNVWAPFTVDVTRGLVYLPVSTPSNDFYGGDRKGAGLFGESLVCLDANTGRRLWHFQTVHHGLWDYDLPAPPSLITIHPDGRTIDAVAVVTKTGFVFTFDRMTGRPVWPVEERPVPPSDVPGEEAWPTQPFPTRPAPFAVQGFTLDDVADFTPEIKALGTAEVQKYRMGPLFNPPSLQGSIQSPGIIGGAGWGGAAFDPETQTLYVKATNAPYLARLMQPPRSDTINARYAFDRSASLGIRAPADVADGDRSGRQERSLPINKPPFGTLVAIDMNKGERRWQVTVGDTPWIHDHPLLRGVKLGPLGVSGSPGPIVTAGGLVFVTGGGSVLYAFDKTSGNVLWQVDLGQDGYAVPMTYATNAGRQYVVIATGEGDHAALKAFALP
jgi:quinoprotein glucose dehydrogenase